MLTVGRRLVVGVVVVSTALLAGAAFAGPARSGSFDRSFGNGGKAYADFGRGTVSESAADVAVQSSGKVVAVGALTTTDAARWAIARWRDDGKPDNRFSSNGRAVTAIGSRDSARVVVLRGSGRALVGGTSDGRFALVAYASDGSLDRSWGGDGIVTTEVAAGSAVVLDMRVLDDGSVTAAGKAGDRLVATHYSSDGSLDPSYGDGGVVTSTQPFAGTVNDVSLQPDGDLLATGRSDVPGAYSVRTVRLDADGTPDPTFGAGGEVTTEPEDSDASSGRAVIVQPDGKVLVGGSSYGPGDYSYELVLRYLPDGTLDPTFGERGGYVTGGSDYYSQVNDLALQPDGRIVTTGFAVGEDPHRLSVARYTAAGDYDTSFNGKGYRTVGFDAGPPTRPEPFSEGLAVAFSGGSIYAVGSVDYRAGVKNATFLAVRLKR